MNGQGYSMRKIRPALFSTTKEMLEEFLFRRGKTKAIVRNNTKKICRPDRKCYHLSDGINVLRLYKTQMLPLETIGYEKA
jgi:DNA polymerase III alpha subunit (gram-positive type)